MPIPFRIKYQVLGIKGLFLKFCLAFILLTTYYILHTTPVFAQESTQTSDATPSSFVSLPTSISPTSPAYTDLIVHNMFHTFSCLTVGGSIIGQPCLTYQIQKDAQGAIQSVPVLSQVNLGGGALGAATSLIGALYMNPPVRTIDYLASVGQGLGIVKEAHAQGVFGSGQAVLNPVLSLWQVSRNIAYLAMIIIFVIIGLMVMFRQRVNPQTVITAQAALPGLVIGLVLITFSYFFAALISDLSFIGINLVGYYFSAANPSSTPVLTQDIATQNVGSIFSKYVGMITSGDISAVINSFLHSLEGGVQFWVRFLAGIIGFQTGSSIGGPVGALGGVGICAAATGVTGGVIAPIVPFCGILGQFTAGALLGTVLGGIAFGAPGETFGQVLYFVAIAILIYTMFKLLLRLINSFLSILFLTITAPFHFLAASLPGRQGIATAWILNMLCNILAFPAVFAVFYFVAYLFGPNTAPGNLFGITAQLTPTVSNQTLPLFGGLDLHFIRILLAFGALVATPAIPDIICRTIGRVGVAGQLIGQEIQGGTRAGQGYAGRIGTGIGQLRGLGSQLEGLGPRSTISSSAAGPVILRQPGLLGAIRGTPGIATPVPVTPPPGGGGAGGAGGGGAAPPPCLPPYVKISTPFGPRAIKHICKNDIVWTTNSVGHRAQARVKQIVKRKVHEDHKILWLVLADGRQLYSSPGHPNAKGEDLATLVRGDYLDNSQIISIELLAYEGEYTYDILPEGEPGAYFANGILIGSTLKLETSNVTELYQQDYLGT